jgi:hypothetical protein
MLEILTEHFLPFGDYEIPLYFGKSNWCMCWYSPTLDSIIDFEKHCVVTRLSSGELLILNIDSYLENELLDIIQTSHL